MRHHHHQKAITTSFIFCVLLNCLFIGAGWAEAHSIDLDVDGIPDTITVTRQQISDDEVTLNLQIVFSSGAKSIYRKETLDIIDASYFTVYLWRNTPGILVLDYTNRSTRQSSDFHYEIYKWVRNHNKLCLHSSSNGIPANQLAGEAHDAVRFVRLYSDCVGLNEPTPSLDVNNEDYYYKSSIFTFISAKNARLYNTSNESDKSKMYLVFGDKVKVKDYKYIKNTGRDWFLVEYQPVGKIEPITKWINGESVEPNVR